MQKRTRCNDCFWFGFSFFRSKIWKTLTELNLEILKTLLFKKTNKLSTTLNAVYKWFPPNHERRFDFTACIRSYEEFCLELDNIGFI